MWSAAGNDGSPQCWWGECLAVIAEQIQWCRSGGLSLGWGFRRTGGDFSIHSTGFAWEPGQGGSVDAQGCWPSVPIVPVPRALSLFSSLSPASPLIPVCKEGSGTSVSTALSIYRGLKWFNRALYRANPKAYKNFEEEILKHTSLKTFTLHVCGLDYRGFISQSPCVQHHQLRWWDRRCHWHEWRQERIKCFAECLQTYGGKMKTRKTICLNSLFGEGYSPWEHYFCIFVRVRVHI